MHIFDYANFSLPIVIFTKQLLSFLQVVQNLFTENFCDIFCLRLVTSKYYELFTLCAVKVRKVRKKCSQWIIHCLECITCNVEERKFIYGDFTVIFLRASNMVAVSFRFLVSPHLGCSICILTMKGCIWLLFSWVCKEVYADGACYKICPLRSSSRRCLWQAACKAEGQA